MIDGIDHRIKRQAEGQKECRKFKASQDSIVRWRQDPDFRAPSRSVESEWWG